MNLKIKLFSKILKDKFQKFCFIMSNKNLGFFYNIIIFIYAIYYLFYIQQLSNFIETDFITDFYFIYF